jgi:hypothetical protein
MTRTEGRQTDSFQVRSPRPVISHCRYADIHIVARIGDYYNTDIGLTTGFTGSQYSYTRTTESLTITTDSHNWVTTPAESLQGPRPPADPTGSHWPSSNSSGLFSGCRRPSYIAREQTTKKTPSPIPPLLHDVITGTDPKENNSSFHCCVA